MLSEPLDPPSLAAPRSWRLAQVTTPTWALVLISRLLALGTGAIGAVLAGRVVGWRQYDPSGVSEHLGQLGNVLAGSVVRWDSIHYLQIAAHGYSQVGNTVFFPLYPALIAALTPITGSGVLAGFLLSAVAFVVALVLLHRLTTRELDARAARATVILLAFAPTAFFFTAVYTESLFLALSVGALYAARQERWLIASLCAAAATLTRVPGVLLFVPLAVMYVDAQRASAPGTGRLQALQGAAPLALIPLALSAFLVYLDVNGYGLLAPATNQVAVHLHGSAGPIATIIRAFKDGLLGAWRVATGAQAPAPVPAGAGTAAFTNVSELVVFLISVAALVQCFRRLPRAYGFYSLSVLLLCVWSPSQIVPMLSLNRYVLAIFPLWMVAGETLSRRRLMLPTTLLGAGLMGIYAFEFARWAFVA